MQQDADMCKEKLLNAGGAREKSDCVRAAETTSSLSTELRTSRAAAARLRGRSRLLFPAHKSYVDETPRHCGSRCGVVQGL